VLPACRGRGVDDGRESKVHKAHILRSELLPAEPPNAKHRKSEGRCEHREKRQRRKSLTATISGTPMR
jgi:hypothetical protein